MRDDTWKPDGFGGLKRDPMEPILHDVFKVVRVGDDSYQPVVESTDVTEAGDDGPRSSEVEAKERLWVHCLPMLKKWEQL